MKPGERLEWNMTRDESLVFGSTMSDFKFLLEHEVSVLEIALAAVSFEDCSLDGSVPLDRVVVAYDYWLGALDALHPGHDFRRFGLSDLELSDDDLLGRFGEWLSGSPRLTVRMPVCRSVSFLLLVWEMLDGFIRRPDANCNSSTDSKCFIQVSYLSYVCR